MAIQKGNNPANWGLTITIVANSGAWEFYGRYKLWPLLPYELKQLADPCAQRFVVGPSVGVVEVDWNSSTLRDKCVTSFQNREFLLSTMEDHL